MANTTRKYICTKQDLDKVLDGSLKRQLNGLFYHYAHDGSRIPRFGSWGMFMGESSSSSSPDAFLLSAYGIDLRNPRVRDAVALDLVKLDDGSVSNSSIYTYDIHSSYSQDEYDIFLLNRNFRINLTDIEDRFQTIIHASSSVVDTSYSVEMMYQGVVLSETVVKYIGSVMSQAFTSDSRVDSEFSIGSVVVPFTNGLDISTELALVPSTHADFPESASRSYYDMKHEEYRNLLRNSGIRSVSSFALVDQDHGKNHTGVYRIRAQKVLSNGSFGYMDFMIDRDGQFTRNRDGDVDAKFMTSQDNLIVCLCEDDFNRTSATTSQETWIPATGDIPVPMYTTSSNYSVFDQYIPDSELRDVRNYIQFKLRLSGMEMCLDQLDRDIQSKQVQTSWCFMKLANSILELFSEFNDRKELMDLVMELYGLIEKSDSLVVSKSQLELMLDDRSQKLKELVEEYNGLGNSKMNEKIALGQKISSIRLELDGRIQKSIDSVKQMIDDTNAEFSAKRAEIDEIQGTPSGDSDIIDTTSLDQLVRETEMWNSYMYNLGYELDQMKKMKTRCEDATIKVRRLLRNFKDRIEKTQGEVWTNSKGKWNDDFDISGIALSGIRDIILLYDWHGYNADGKSYSELGYSSQEGLEHDMETWQLTSLTFRRYLYSETLTRNIQSIQQVISDIRDGMENRKQLEYHDEYGRGTEDESSSGGGSGKHASLDPFAEADRLLSESRGVVAHERGGIGSTHRSAVGYLKDVAAADRQLNEDRTYERDRKHMHERTVEYLKNIGVIDKENDLQTLATRSLAVHYEGNIDTELRKVETAKHELTRATDAMMQYRKSIQSIIDSLSRCEQRIQELKDRNAAIVSECRRTKMKRKDVNQLMIEKLENESTIADLRSMVKKGKQEHLSNFSTLENLRAKVDQCQKRYDESIYNFRNNIGFDEETIQNMIVGIYNRYQNEILRGTR